MTNVVLTYPEFRTRFTAFANATTYPDATLQVQFDLAQDYISPTVGWVLTSNQRETALYLMVAHLMFLRDKAALGQPAQGVQSASEGAVSVSFITPQKMNAWQTWLYSSPYGQQLWALLTMKTVGGFNSASNYNRLGFRSPRGTFGS